MVNKHHQQLLAEAHHKTSQGDPEMKRLPRFLIPLAVLAVLALSVAGVALAREMTNSDFFKMRDEEIEFTGVLQSINGISMVVDGRTVLIPASAEIKDALVVGQIVKVHASKADDGTLTAREVEQVGADDVSNSNANDNADDSLEDNANENENDNDDVFEDDNANDNEDDSIEDNANDNSSGDDDGQNNNSNDNNDDHEDGSNDNSHQDDDHSGGHDNGNHDGGDDGGNGGGGDD